MPVVKLLPVYYCVHSVTLFRLDLFQLHLKILKSSLLSLKKLQPLHPFPVTIPPLFSFTTKLFQRIDYICWIHSLISQSSFNTLKSHIFPTITFLKQLLLSSMTSVNSRFYGQFFFTFLDLLAHYPILLKYPCLWASWFWFSFNLYSFSFPVPFSGSSYFVSHL